MRTSYPGLRTDGDNPDRNIALIVNNILRGALNVVVEFDIPAAAVTVNVLDGRISELSVPLLPVGSSVTSYTYVSAGFAVVGVTAGAARTERLVVLG